MTENYAAEIRALIARLAERTSALADLAAEASNHPDQQPEARAEARACATALRRIAHTCANAANHLTATLGTTHTNQERDTK